MDHARHLTAVFRLHGKTVAAVALGDHRLLEIGAGAAVYHGIKLGSDLVIGLGHGPADLAQAGAGVVRDLILGENAAAYGAGHGGKGLQLPKHLIQGIVRDLLVGFPGVGFYPAAGLQQLAHIQQLRNV